MWSLRCRVRSSMVSMASLIMAVACLIISDTIDSCARADFDFRHRSYRSRWEKWKPIIRNCALGCSALISRRNRKMRNTYPEQTAILFSKSEGPPQTAKCLLGQLRGHKQYGKCEFLLPSAAHSLLPCPKQQWHGTVQYANPVALTSGWCRRNSEDGPDKYGSTRTIC